MGLDEATLHLGVAMREAAPPQQQHPLRLQAVSAARLAQAAYLGRPCALQGQNTKLHTHMGVNDQVQCEAICSIEGPSLD